MEKLFTSILLLTLSGCTLSPSPGEVEVTLAHIQSDKEVSLAIINQDNAAQRADRRFAQDLSTKASADAQRPEGSGEIPDEHDPGYEPIAEEPEEKTFPKFFKEVPHTENNPQTKVHSIAGGDSVVIQHSPGAQINVGNRPDPLALAKAKRLNRAPSRLKTWDEKVKNVSAPVVSTLQTFFPWFFGSKIASTVVKEVGDAYNLDNTDFATSGHQESSHNPVTETTSFSTESHE